MKVRVTPKNILNTMLTSDEHKGTAVPGTIPGVNIVGNDSALILLAEEMTQEQIEKTAALLFGTFVHLLECLTGENEDCDEEWENDDAWENGEEHSGASLTVNLLELAGIPAHAPLTIHIGQGEILIESDEDCDNE